MDARAGEAGRAGPDTDVIVVGAGPVGLMVAAELRLGGARVIVLDRLLAPATESRASTLHARTMEIFDSRGLLARLGEPPHDTRGHFGGLPLDLTVPSRYAGLWKVAQTATEHLLAGWALTCGADLRRGWEVLEVTDGGERVEITAAVTGAGVRRLTARYLVACDGQDSAVRALTGVAFPGRPARRVLLRADVAGIDVRDRRFERLEGGLAIAARGPGGVTRVMVHEFAGAGRDAPAAPRFADVVRAWRAVTGEDIGTGTPLWVNSFDDANRQLTRYRHGRVLFAGDAAHQQLPSGGQALNLGLQDAFNLGWKLARQVRPTPPADLLESYHLERHAVGARVLANIRAQALLLLGGPDVEPVRALLGELIPRPDTRAQLAGMISGLDVRYDGGGCAHPLTGARLPEVRLVVAGVPTTTTVLLRAGRGLFLDFGSGDFGSGDVGGGDVGGGDFEGGLAPGDGRWGRDVTVVRADRLARGPLAGVAGALVRPDGHVAWIGGDRGGADEAVRRWFGPQQT